MNKIINLNNGVSNAFIEAMNAIEAGKYNKVIRLLNYVKDESENYDRVMVEYALLISYVNTGKLDEAKNCISNLDTMYIENIQMKQIIEQIKNDVLKSFNSIKTNQVISFESVLEELKIDASFIKKIASEHPEDPYFQMFVEAIDDEENVRDEAIKEVSLARVDMRELIDKLVNFIEFNETLKPIHLFEMLNEYEADSLRWLLVSKNDIDKIYQNRRLPSFIRKYILERAVHYVHYGIIEDFSMRINGEMRKLSSLPDFNKQFFEIVNDVNAYYNINENIYDMISSVLNIVYVNNYPENIFNNINKLHAVIGYIVNDIFVGRKYDKIIEQKTGYKFDDVKSEIKNMELLITFLIS